MVRHSRACWPATFANKPTPKIDSKAARKLTYGLFLLSGKDEKDNGCIINSCIQAASEPLRLIICCQMGNLTREIIEKSLGACNILKINREEYDFLIKQGYAADKEELAEKYDIDIVLLTLDKDGAEVYGKKIKESIFAEGIKTEVVSTVGAGDSMCACFLYNLLNGKDAETAIRRANILASYVVSHKEAIPEYTKELLEKIR